MIHSPTFWVAISFFLFLLLVYKYAKKIIFEALDNRADKIRKELEEMNDLKIEASNILGETKKRQNAAKKEIDDLMNNAELEMKKMRDNAALEMKNYLDKRTSQIMERISSQESEIVDNLRKQTVEITIKVVNQVIKDNLDNKLSSNLVNNTIELTSKKFH